MKIFVLTSTLCLMSLLVWAKEPMQIISDVDDTVKVTHVGSPGSAARAVFRLHVFSGMPTLYRELEPERLVFVSGSPSFLEGNVKSFLGYEGFPDFELFTRDFFARPEIAAFKTARITKLLSESPSKSFVLIGDDTELDPEVYQDISAKFPGQVQAIFIRKVKGRAGLQGQQPFHTAMDVALKEVEAGRLSIAGANRVAESILHDPEAPEENLIPHFADCPPRGWLVRDVSFRSPLFFSAMAVQERVETLCEARSAIEIQ